MHAYSWYLKKQGYVDVDDGLESTIPIRTRMLKHLLHLGANLYDPENVKEIIALQSWKEGTKANYKYAYESFLKMEGLTWTPPKYTKPESLPFVPYEEEIETLINACGRKVSIFLQGLKETGADPGELWRAEWTDINEKTRTIDIRHPVKRHSTRVLPISKEWLGRLELLRNNNSHRIFAMTIGAMRSNFDMQRRRKTNEFKNPRLKKVTFTSIRHWKATVEYHKTKDILHVKQLLGHKSIRNTMIYIDIERALYGSDHNAEYISRAATSVKGARRLIEAGFEYVTEMSGYKLFRKRK